MSNDVMALAQSVRSMRPMVPAKTLEISKRFYVDLGFKPRSLTDSLIEMRLGAYAFILQDYYVQQWADNFVMHISAFRSLYDEPKTVSIKPLTRSRAKGVLVINRQKKMAPRRERAASSESILAGNSPLATPSEISAIRGFRASA